MERQRVTDDPCHKKQRSEGKSKGEKTKESLNEKLIFPQEKYEVLNDRVRLPQS